MIRKRPILVSVVCWLGFTALIFGLLTLLFDYWVREQPLHSVLNAVLGAGFIITAFAALLGYWNMRRWGVITFALAAILAHTYWFVIMGVVRPMPIIVQTVTIAIGAAYWRQMR